MFLEVFIDPFVLFCVSCIALPLVADREELTHSDVVEYLTAPAFLFTAALLLAVVAEAKIARWRRRSPPLASFYARLRARWYLLNGVVIHVFLDALVGVFKQSALLARSCARVDRRYNAALGDFDGSAVHVLSLMELCVQGPLCVLLYRAYQTHSPHRDALELIVCATQAYGTVVYLGQEFLTGMTHFDVDYELQFTPHYLLYFWFAIVLGCVLYLVVPCLWGRDAYTRLVEASARAPFAKRTAPRVAARPRQDQPEVERQKKNA